MAANDGWLGLLEDGMSAAGLTLTEGQAAKFERYLRCLQAASARLNLTAVLDPEDVAVKHFLDSVQPLGLVEFPVGARVVDVGSGAGFPGLPLAIVREDLEVTLVEATAKKAAFLEELRQDLGLSGVRVLSGRAEEIGRMPFHRERYQVGVVRAVAALPVIWEYLLPLVSVGGIAVAWKGPGLATEWESGQRAAEKLGGGQQRQYVYRLLREAGERRLVVVPKMTATPDGFPRRPGMPAKRPL